MSTAFIRYVVEGFSRFSLHFEQASILVRLMFNHVIFAHVPFLLCSLVLIALC